ncbi:MAG: hypothetical protein IT360_03720 [Gemmatimonadaceae bacterium]|nr:hypothetical protein [Gemmatimonadaceae bacterium]
MRLRVPRPVGLRSLVLAALCPVALLAQVRPESTSGVAAASIAAAPQAAGQAAGQAPDSSRVAPTGTTAARPLSDSLTLGGRVVPAGTTVQGPIVVAGGDLDVRGTIVGSAVAIAGNVVVHDGGRITGDAIAAFGAVTLDGGTIGGAMRSLTGLWGESLRSTFRGDEGVAPTSRSPLQLALGWFAVMLLIGLGVLVFASNYLDGVVDVLQESFWRSFFVGIAGELGVIPAMLLLIVGLAITIIGALLIPFAMVAFVLAVAGLATLGFIAVATLTGGGLGSRSAQRLSARGGALRSVVVGVSLYMGIWLVAAALGFVPAAGTILRLVAILVTYVAVTAGFGAALLSRGGTRRDATVIQAAAPALGAASWQTPTPVTGVVAARRPVVAAKADAGTSGRGL